LFIHYRTEGIFLKKIDRGEADQLLIVYTKNFGKLEILARSIRKISSKLRSGADIFCLSEIEFVQGKTQKTLTDAILIEKFDNLKNDLTKIKVAYKIAETADDLIKAPEPDNKIWRLLNEVFQKLNKYTINPFRCTLIYYYFFWNLVSLLGYQPKIKDCTVQGKKFNCDTVKIIKLILKKEWEILLRLKIKPPHLKSLQEAAQWYKVKLHEL